MLGSLKMFARNPKPPLIEDPVTPMELAVRQRVEARKNLLAALRAIDPTDAPAVVTQQLEAAFPGDVETMRMIAYAIDRRVDRMEDE